jgi:hypothetical protein
MSSSDRRGAGGLDMIGGLRNSLGRAGDLWSMPLARSPVLSIAAIAAHPALWWCAQTLCIVNLNLGSAFVSVTLGLWLGGADRRRRLGNATETRGATHKPLRIDICDGDGVVPRRRSHSRRFGTLCGQVLDPPAKAPVCRTGGALPGGEHLRQTLPFDLFGVHLPKSRSSLR